MIRFLPIVLLLLQTLPFAAPVTASPQVEKMSCCSGSCACAVASCQCNGSNDEESAPVDMPFSVRSIDFAPPISKAIYQFPTLTQIGEDYGCSTTITAVAQHNCRLALLGRWQN